MSHFLSNDTGVISYYMRRRSAFAAHNLNGDAVLPPEAVEKVSHAGDASLAGDYGLVRRVPAELGQRNAHLHRREMQSEEERDTKHKDECTDGATDRLKIDRGSLEG